MLMPSATTVSDLLSDLLGEDQPLESRRDAFRFDDLVGGFGAICRDQDDQPICAILTDLVATVSLGGKLMLLPQCGLQGLVEEGQADELILEGLVEVFAQLSHSLEQAEGNPPLCPGPAAAVAEILDSGDGAWLREASAGRAYDGEFCCGAGRVVILVR